MNIDENMSEGGSEQRQESASQQIPQLQVKRADSDIYNATYSFLDEDHTLGNLLRN